MEVAASTYSVKLQLDNRAEFVDHIPMALLIISPDSKQHSQVTTQVTQSGNILLLKVDDSKRCEQKDKVEKNEAASLPSLAKDASCEIKVEVEASPSQPPSLAQDASYEATTIRKMKKKKKKKKPKKNQASWECRNVS